MNRSSTIVVGVVGNPNCGKTTLFNALTGTRQHVGNWPGVTVEKKVGHFSIDGVQIELVDLPGTYSLEQGEDEISIDEQIARDYVASREADLIVNIVDASNLERNLYLTSQLLEMKVPVLIALNMLDAADKKGVSVNLAGLQQALESPVCGLVASTGEGVDGLCEAILKLADEPVTSSISIDYGEHLEAAIVGLLPQTMAIAAQHQVDNRWLALGLLEEDSLAGSIGGTVLQPTVEITRQKVEEALADDIDIIVADARYNFINRITRELVVRQREVTRSSSDRIDHVVLNRLLGIPIFLLMMYLMFMFTINFGGAFIDFFDQLAGTLFVEGAAELMTVVGLPQWLTVLLANGIGGGIQVVATFIPIIGSLFLFLSVLEDSGYMARAAFVMDRAMRAVGLPGKAFVPLLVGFGCNVPAIMATRTMEHQRDRLLTITMAPFMSCGARLPIYALFAAAFFPVGGQNVVFALYLIGIGAAVATGLVMKSTLLRGESAPFILELPTYHVPTIKGVLIHTWDRLKGFVIRAGQLIVPMVLVLNVLNSVGRDGSFGNEDSEESVLSAIGETIAPAFSPLGLDKQNWPAAVGIFTGVLAKEAVVGTLDALYSEIAKQELANGGQLDGEPEAFDLWSGLGGALQTIPDNLAELSSVVTDPLGINIGDVSTAEAAAEQQEVEAGTFGAMASRFDGKAGAFAYLLFVLLYFPCVAATAAVFREAGGRWALFVVGWTTGFAYGAATISYQLAIFSRHPLSSASWVAGMLLLWVGVFLVLRRAASNTLREVPQAAPL
ncbi:MAG: ferrous iron transporter B [Gammaproteobacteria bacterium]|nr:MAG: ferrous iron transporter B [Gammaproteobacteria bacterium]RLA13867.1 MAG: ferrous iron transporter B [Gammaproteobacteria bacterium]